MWFNIIGSIKFDFYCTQSCLVERNLHRIRIDAISQAEIDLIRDFSLQVHHEQCSLKANGFFNLNLEVMGSVSQNSPFYLISKRFHMISIPVI